MMANIIDCFAIRSCKICKEDSVPISTLLFTNNKTIHNNLFTIIKIYN